MYTLKSIARRGTAFGAALALVAGVVVPTASVFADALNPLTERSLLLSSSAPGYQNTDGSGNSESTLNAAGETYAPPGSGPNGMKTGETFTFRVSTDSAAASRPIKAFTFQYCTTAAGLCQAPGNNAGDARAVDPFDDEVEDYDAEDPDTWATRVPDRETNADALANKTSDLDVHYSSPVLGTDFDIYVDLNNDGDFDDAGEQPTTGWTMTTSNVEDIWHSGTLTGKNNFITLTSSTGFSPVFNSKIQIVFNADEDDYITNPGDDSFFVKINTYDSDNSDHHVQNIPQDENDYIIDGGVTVANVMTDSIHITTKVLETMAFSVGTQNRDTVDLTSPVTHGHCDPILQIDNNRLQLGNPDAEYSLETDTAWDVYSYWRLSSNSSGGATVYYSGNTLANTVGDEIREIGPSATTSNPGTEQFGLGFVDATTDDTGKFDSDFTDLVDLSPDDNFRMPTLYYLQKKAAYAGGEGTINGGSPTATFAFEKESNTIPRVIAENNDHVISCDTAKMRYIANIGADTPAGVYTTKINYLAAPQY